MRTRKPASLYRVPEDEVNALINALPLSDEGLRTKLTELGPPFKFNGYTDPQELRELAAAAIILARRLDA